jgi:hypothetical protein
LQHDIIAGLKHDGFCHTWSRTKRERNLCT